MSGGDISFRGANPSLSNRCQANGPLGTERNAASVNVHASDIDRLLDAAYQALPMMPGHVREKVAELLTPEAMGVIAGVAALWAGSHFFGVGFVADIVIGGVTIISIGWDAITALKGYARYYDRAVNACTPKDITAAAEHFASATLTLAGAIGWTKLAAWLGKGGTAISRMRGATKAAQMARWERYIAAIEFDVPAGQGMLWTKLGERAQELARQQGLTTLEMQLRKNGFFKLYEREFGDTQSEVTAKIWELVSRRYVKSLRGKVTAYVDAPAHFNASKPGVISAELQEIRDILLGNAQITEVIVINKKAGALKSPGTFSQDEDAIAYYTRDVLLSLQKLEQRNPGR